MSEPATGPELLDDYIGRAKQTLDLVLDRSPEAQPLTDSELQKLVVDLRGERAQIDVKQEKAKDKKAGIVEDSDG